MAHLIAPPTLVDHDRFDCVYSGGAVGTTPRLNFGLMHVLVRLCRKIVSIGLTSRGPDTMIVRTVSELRPHIIFAEPFNESARDCVAEIGRVTVLHSNDESSLLEAIVDCDALLVRTSTQVTRKIIERATRLRVIGRGGVGLDNIDVEAAKEKGITIVYTPQAGTDAVADLTVGMIISLVRKIKDSDHAVREQQHTAWRKKQSADGLRELHELTLGVIGMGRIGRAVSKRLFHGFDMKIVYNDIVDVKPPDFPAESMEKDQLYRQADIVSLHLPLTDDTRHLINENTLSKLKDGAFLVNTSRGAVVDNKALASALQSGKLSGAALDVFDPEPLPADHPLMHAPNTLFTPHIGSRTQLSLAKMNAVVEDVVRVLQDQPPEHAL